MIKSMTGYGRGQAGRDGLSFTVEIKTVNHRYGDISIKAPRLLAAYEAGLKKQVAAVLKRGKIDLFISQERSGEIAAVPEVDELVVKGWLAALDRLKQISGLENSVGLEFLAAQKDVLIVKDTEFDADLLRACLDQALEEALDNIVAMRALEGEATARDIAARLDLLGELLQQIEGRAPQVPLEWRDKLSERLAKLNDSGTDPQRLAQEIAIYADRCDISEEITRFNSHLDQFRSLMTQAEPVGRQLDFLVQELNREANTIGSKANDAELTRYVVSLKSELEKIREQVQNIE